MAVQGATKEKSRAQVKEPKKYAVLMLNDDFTTMEFVVSVLIDIFHKDQVSAEAIMLNVHKNGQAVVGQYSYDIAMTRVEAALKRAKAEGFPFRMRVKEA